MKQSAQDLNSVPGNKPECWNLPQIYQQTTWLLFQMRCKGKHAEELQDGYEQPSCGGPHKNSHGEKDIQREKGAISA